jgi:DNA-binding transcriptional MerR regulator
MAKAADAFRTISEVADDLGIQKHVLRFWEVKFAQIRPMKRGGGRRYYRPEDMELLRGIRQLLHRDGYTIKGVQKILREQGLDAVKTCWQPGEGLQPPSPRSTAASQTTKSRGAPRGKSTPALSPPVVDDKALLARIVSELQACRALLRGESAAETAAAAPRARARR